MPYFPGYPDPAFAPPVLCGECGQESPDSKQERAPLCRKCRREQEDRLAEEEEGA